MKKKSLLYFTGSFFVLVLINILLSSYYFSIDLTEDKRYTISSASESLLSKIDDEVSVVVYLEGSDLPSGFRRLHDAIEEKLEEFKNYSDGNISYIFVDPNEIADAEKRKKFYVELAQKGIQPTNLHVKENDKTFEKLIFPGAVISYKGKEISLLLLKGTKSSSPEQILNQSVENVEYALSDAIRKLTITHKKQIGILSGHGEPADIQIADLITSLQSYYEVFRVPISQIPDTSIQNLDALMIIKPDTAYSEEDKYKLDQFIVNGGKALFFVDALKIDAISQEGTLAVPHNLNINDLFFKYGFRINQNIVKDLTSAKIPMMTGNMGNQAQTQFMPYRYFPLINNFASHPITRNSDVIYSKYVGTIDTIKAHGIRKTPLLFTSQYTKVLSAPVLISYNDARKDGDPNTFNRGVFPVAYLLEGSFHSLFSNRITPSDPRSSRFKEYGKPSKIIVSSDGDLPMNAVNPKTGQPSLMGFDPFSQQLFGNKEFVLHSVDYLLEENGIINARNKEIVLRPLDKLKIREERTYWQALNILFPVLLLFLFGIIWSFMRKRKFAVSA